MARLASKRPAALRDLAETGAYIGRDSLGAEIHFYEAAERTFTLLLERPGLGHSSAPQGGPTGGLRVQPIRGFPNWLVFYRPTADGIEVVRVLHGVRDVGTILASEMTDQPDDE